MRYILILTFSLLLSNTLLAQAPQPPAEKSRYTLIGAPIPPFRIDKTLGGVFTNLQIKKNKPVMIMLFSPECGHCEHFIDSLKTISTQFKATQLVLVAEERHKAEMAGFIKKLQLDKNIVFTTIGTNRGELIAALYTYKVLPQIMFYNTSHKLVKIFDGQYLFKDVAKYIK